MRSMKRNGLGFRAHFNVGDQRYQVRDHPEVRALVDGTRGPAVRAVSRPQAQHRVQALAASALAGLEMSAVPARGEKYHWPGWRGDQGPTSQCTAYGLLHAMSDGPVTQRRSRRDRPMDDPGRVYDGIVAQDRRQGRHFAGGGATMDALARYARAAGWISAWWHGYTIGDYIAAVQRGPVLLGVPWLEGMFFPDRKHGVIRAFGQEAGGHCIDSPGADLDDGMATVDNSWGRAWGKNGRAQLPFEDLEWLLANGGELVIFDEVRQEPVAG